jgi:hypothetical protein
MTEENKMTFVIKKPIAETSDFTEMIQKIRQISKKRWRVTYSTNKEDRLSAVVSADTYTGAYIDFLCSHSDAYVIEISEV